VIVEGTEAAPSNLFPMAGRSGYVIELSAEERAELERRVACYTLPHKVVVRAKMILYAAEGQPNTEIARRLETAPRVVGRWRKRFFEERLAGLEDRERAGRPRRFPPGAGGGGEGARLRAAGHAGAAAFPLLAH
jgi:hypothetical protein